MLKAFNENSDNFKDINKEEFNIKLIVAEYEKKIIAGIVVAYFGDTVTYIHGASSNESRNVMAPFLLQWKTIQLAKDLGYKKYDLNGVDAEKWPGVTRFKMGFSRSATIPNNDRSKIIIFPGTFDLIFDTKWYSVYKIARKLRRMF